MKSEMAQLIADHAHLAVHPPNTTLERSDLQTPDANLVAFAYRRCHNVLWNTLRGWRVYLTEPRTELPLALKVCRYACVRVLGETVCAQVGAWANGQVAVHHRSENRGLRQIDQVAGVLL